jgi:hypothetical protein
MSQGCSSLSDGLEVPFSTSLDCFFSSFSGIAFERTIFPLQTCIYLLFAVETAASHQMLSCHLKSFNDNTFFTDIEKLFLESSHEQKLEQKKYKSRRSFPLVERKYLYS